MVKVANLSADLTANTADFDGKLTRARGSLARTGRSMSRNAESFNKNISNSFRRAAASAAAFEGPLGGIAGRLSGLASIATSTGVALGGALLALSGTAFVIGKAAKVADDFEGSMNRVNAILKATRGASAQSAEGIREFSEEIAAGTLASVAGVEAAAAKLLTFRRISGDTFKRTLVLAQDLAAAGFGSLSDNVTQLGKALEDPIRNLGALTRNGVSFSEAQRKVIKSLIETGRAAEAQAKILDAIQQQVGGAGAAEGGPIAKGLDLLSQRLDDFFISLDKATGAGNAFAKFLNLLSRSLDGLTENLDPTGPALIEQMIKEAEQLNLMIEQADAEIRELQSRPETAANAAGQVEAAIQIQKQIVEALRQRIYGEEDAAAAIRDRAKAEQDAIQAEFEASKVAKAREAEAKLFAKEQSRREASLAKSIETLQIEVNALDAESQAFKNATVSIQEAAIARQVLTAQQKQGLQASDDEAEIIEYLIRQRARLTGVISKEQDVRKRAAQIIEANKTETQKLNEEIREFISLRQQGFLTEEQTQTAITRTKEKIDDLSESNKELKRVLGDVSNSVQGAFEDFVLGADSAGDAVRKLGLELARVALRETTSSLFGGIIKSAASSLFGGFFADGGRPPVGKFSIVGENGPEVFAPDTAGTIIPNDQLGGGGGPTIFADMRGASVEAVQRLERFVIELNGSIEPRAVAAVSGENQRDPTLLGATG